MNHWFRGQTLHKCGGRARANANVCADDAGGADGGARGGPVDHDGSADHHDGRADHHDGNAEYDQ